MARISSRELTEWLLYFEIKAEEAELAHDGLTPDEIEDAIAHRGDSGARDWATMLDPLLSLEEQSERLQQVIDEEERDDAEGDGED